MPTITLTGQDKARVVFDAHRQSLTCKVCSSSDLLSRDTGQKYANVAVRVYLDCANNEDHETGPSVQSEPPPPPPPRRPGETTPRV